ncbi:MAG: hypothetical protein MRJ96_06940 [Nitrospirales bacterium]|nr:hypothetical protein [Nitrospirales bacterium]
MSFKIFLLSIAFIISGGSLFADTFRKNWLLMGIAVVIATLSTYYLFDAIYEDVIGKSKKNEYKIAEISEEISRLSNKPNKTGSIEKSSLSDQQIKKKSLEKSFERIWENPKENLFEKWNEDLASKAMKEWMAVSDFNDARYDIDEDGTYEILSHVDSFWPLDLPSGKVVIGIGFIMGQSCEACMGEVNIVKFTNNNNGYWGVRTHKTFLAGDRGYPPKQMRVLKIGSDNYGVFLEHKFFLRGGWYETGRLFAEINGNYKEVFKYFKVAAGLLTGERYRYSKISFDPEKGKDYFDIIVRSKDFFLKEEIEDREILDSTYAQKFSQLDESEIEKEVYKFNGREYISTTVSLS